MDDKRLKIKSNTLTTMEITGSSLNFVCKQENLQCKTEGP